MTEADIQRFWDIARETRDADWPAEPPEAWAFGDSPELADELLELVLDGRKTATCDALWRYEVEQERLSEPGDLWIILDGEGSPRCVIETIEVNVRPMNEVDETFAFDEGEDDRSWSSWYAAHERYFRRTLAEIDRAFEPTMPLVLERFARRFP